MTQPFEDFLVEVHNNAEKDELGRLGSDTRPPP